MLAIMIGLDHRQAAGIHAGFRFGRTARVLPQKPEAYSWRQLAGAGALAGIGFTMSLFIAGQAFPVPSDFAAAKIAVFVASLLSALAGVAVLWHAQAENSAGEG